MNSIVKPVLRLPFGMGRLLWTPDQGVGVLPAQMFFGTDLKADYIHDGELFETYELGSGLVTTAGVNYMAADMNDGASDISAFDHHGVGIGTTAAATGDTALENVTGVPARVAGTPSNPTSNQYRSVATVSFTSTLAITEWGLFSASTAGTLWDRRVFAAINVVNGDSIQFTYTLTINAGG